MKRFAFLSALFLGLTLCRAQTVPPVQTLAEFTATGVAPRGALLEDAQGDFFGVTEAGGAHNLGTIFELIPDGTLYILYEFDGYSGGTPAAGLVYGADGDLYGTTIYGGSDFTLGPGGYYGQVGKGTVFKITPDGVFSSVASFGDQPAGGPSRPRAGLLLGDDGNFYGTSSAGGSADLGTVYRLTPAGDVSVMVNFDGTNGAGPAAPLIQTGDHFLYGTTQGARTGDGLFNGSAFRLAIGGAPVTLTTFAPVNQMPGGPTAPLVVGPDGNFYGTTEMGGNNFFGSIFKVTPGGTFSDLHDFSSSLAVDGETPEAGLIVGADHALYGTTRYGNTAGTSAGVIYRITTDGAYSILATPENVRPPAAYSLSGVYYQQGSTGPLIIGGDGNFYGTTSGGGNNGLGQIFRLTPAGDLTTLGFFFFYYGVNPTALTLDPSGTLYGVTAAGGYFGSGTAISVAPDGTISKLADFNPYDAVGINPSTPLVRGPDGNFYGVTNSDAAGDFRSGTLYKLTPGGTLTAVAAPPSLPSGAGPLTLGADGKLYGLSLGTFTTGDGGKFFRVEDNAAVTVLHTFPVQYVTTQLNGLTLSPAGDFYGVTVNNGANNKGQVFKLTTAGAFSTVVDFNGTNGSTPEAELALGHDGNFYGATLASSSGSPSGILYQLTLSGTITTLAHGSFINQNGGYGPRLAVASDGSIYGNEATANFFRLGADGALNSVAYIPQVPGSGGEGVGSGSDFAFTAGPAGTVYATSVSGGNVSAGAIFKYDPGVTPTPTPTPAPTRTPTPTPTRTPTPFPVTPTPVPTPTPTPPPGSTPVPTPTPTPTPASTALAIYGLSKNVGGDKGSLTLTISGSGFDLNTVATLTRVGAPTITATGPSLVDNGFGLRLTFDLLGAPDGFYTLTLANPGGVTASKTAALKVVPGTFTIDRTTGGDLGTATFTLANNGNFAVGATARLSAPGQPDLTACAVSQNVEAGTLTATFNLIGRAHGDNAVTVVDPDGKTQPTALSITVEAGQGPQTYGDLVGRPIIRVGYPQSYTVVVGNRGDNDALGVPVLVYVPVNWIVAPPAGLIHVSPPPADAGEPVPPETPDFNLTLSDDGTQHIVALIVPFVAAGGSQSIQLPITVPPETAIPHQKLNVGVQVGSPFFGQAAAPDPTYPLTNAAGRGPRLRDDVTIVIDGVPYVIPEKCVVSLIKFGFSSLGVVLPASTCFQRALFFLYGTAARYQATGFYDLDQVGADALTLMIRCAISSVPGVGNAYSAITATLALTKVIINCIDDPIKDLQLETVTANDPNDLVGSVGDGSASHFVTGADALRYTIYFENQPTASAPAQMVAISDALDPNLFNLSTVKIEALGFGSNVVTPPPGLSSYSTVVDLRPANPLLVKIAAGVDAGTNTLKYTFASVDPTTGQAPADPLAGFLPPDGAPPAGEGFVTFSVRAKAGQASGAAINNQASIVFDRNAAIATPVWLNTIDSVAPTSVLKAIPAKQTTAKIKLKLSGTDDGSGVDSYTVYTSEDGGAFTPLLSAAGPKIVFQGVTGHKYRFFAQAHDKAGNFEPLKNVAEAKTTINGVDLVAEWTTGVAATTSATGAIKLKGALTVTNQSSKSAATAGGVVRFYLSRDATLDAGDLASGADVPFAALGASGTAVVKFKSAKLPAGTTVTGMYVIAVINPAAPIAETDYTNNTATFGPLQ